MYGQYEKECRFKLNSKARSFTKGAGKTKGKGEKGVRAVERLPPTVECLEHIDDSLVFMTSYTVWDGEDVSEVHLYIDRARFDHVCPPSLMVHHPILSSSMDINGSIRTADGTAMT